MENGSDDTTKADSSAGEVTPPTEYIKFVRAYLRDGQQKQAYAVLLQAIVDYPGNALILSYYGWLQAILDKKYQSGITACKKAFVVFKASDAQTARLVYPVLYLNLARACVAARRKKEAVEALNKGLSHDRHNVEIKKEFLLLGIRKKPPVPFLSRSHPINRLIGIIFKGSGDRQSQSRRSM